MGKSLVVWRGFCIFAVYKNVIKTEAEWLYASQINERLHPTIHKPMTHKELCDFRALMVARNVQAKRAAGGMVYLVKKRPASDEKGRF